MASRDAESARSSALELEKRVAERFGVLPNFFRLAPETPEITEKLWGFAQAAYLDNPLPSIFKERLFVHLSRFCSVRYCIARHAGFLMGLGRPAGDKQAHAQSIVDIVKLLQRPFPYGRELELRLSLCATCPAPLVEMPTADSQVEEAIFALAGHVFLQTTHASACLDALDRLLGTVRLQYLLLFLAFVRAAHYWTKVHPEIEFEDDIKQLLATHEALANCLLNDPETRSDGVSQSLLDELPSLRLKADKAIGLLAAIVDSSDDAIVSKSLGGVITSWNAGAERIFGYTTEEAVGQHISLIIPPNRLSEERIILERLSRGERIDHFDTVRMRKDGTTLDVSLTISPVRDAAGKIIGASKIARDVTQRKRVERALHESEARFRLLADALDTQVQFRTQELQRRNAEILHQSERLRDLSGRLLLIQDQERRHIARELHDSAGQTLVALGMNLAQLCRRCEAQSCATCQRRQRCPRFSSALDPRDTHDLISFAPTHAGRERPFLCTSLVCAGSGGAQRTQYRPENPRKLRKTFSRDGTCHISSRARVFNKHPSPFGKQNRANPCCSRSGQDSCGGSGSRQGNVAGTIC